MQLNSTEEKFPFESFSEEKKSILKNVQYLVGNNDVVSSMIAVPSKIPFADDVMDFLNEVSKILMTSSEAKAFSDVVTLGFWLRKASLLKLKQMYLHNDSDIHLGRGIAFHIAPSNVPVNYAYSLVTGLLTGNANIVRIPSKDFPQVIVINNAINSVLESHEEIRPYIVLVRYERNQSINDFFSGICDTRIVWGGDNTINELRKSPLKPRAGEVTFADRFSLAVIDSDCYLNSENKRVIAQNFYNDTYLTDQNACTSPRLIVWVGNNREKAKNIFWSVLHESVKAKYTFQTIQGVNKLTKAYLAASLFDGVKIEGNDDNLIVRVKVAKCSADLMKYKDNSGFFFEYDCNDIMEIRDLCNDRSCQTVGYLCDKSVFKPLVLSGVHGIDRIVPIGKTMDFELIWDGYNLTERLTRTVRLV